MSKRKGIDHDLKITIKKIND